jgi:hypothetical protein|tara:strand:+ start:461 stop:634 length:174 start_codon:yes stop_codon:yes gene_type:complete
MILYTEKQLQTAYIVYVRKLHEYNLSSEVYVKIPTLEEFRPLYEEQMEFEYGNDFLQ